MKNRKFQDSVDNVMPRKWLLGWLEKSLWLVLLILTQTS